MTHTDPPRQPPVQELREAAELPAPAGPAEATTTDLRAVPWPAFLGYFLGLGSWGFGGPIATVGYMQRDLVERRRWLARQDFLDGVALGQTMPGPLAAQVVMWLGFLRAAAAAGAIAGAVVVLSRQTIHDWPTVLIAVAALGLLLKWKVKEPILVGLGAAAGLLLHWPW
jgi:chromate transport protein ChrA